MDVGDPTIRTARLFLRPSLFDVTTYWYVIPAPDIPLRSNHMDAGDQTRDVAYQARVVADQALDALKYDLPKAPVNNRCANSLVPYYPFVNPKQYSYTSMFHEHD